MNVVGSTPTRPIPKMIKVKKDWLLSMLIGLLLTPISVTLILMFIFYRWGGLEQIRLFEIIGVLMYIPVALAREFKILIPTINKFVLALFLFLHNWLVVYVVIKILRFLRFAVPKKVRKR